MNAFDELKLKIYDSNLDWTEKENIVNLMESCEEEDLQDVCESVEEMLITEGATNDMNAIFKEFKTEVPKIIRDAKKDYKAKKYSDAINKLERAKSLTEKANTKLKALDVDSIGAIICGNLYQAFVTGLKGLLVGLCTFGLGSAIVGIADTIKIVSGIIEEFKDNENLTPAMLNTRYSTINSSIKSTMRHIDKLIDMIKAESKENKK